MDQMGGTEKFLQAISVSICVVNFLLTTRRILKAIELWKESVILLNNEAVRNARQGVLRFLYEEIYAKVYMQMFRGFMLIGDHTSAIECCSKLLVLFRNCGAKTREVVLSLKLSLLYQRQSKYEKAKELCMNALSITIETGDKRGRGLCCAELGNVFVFVGDYAKAKKYFEKSLLIQKEIGDKDGEAKVYGNLGYVFSFLGDYVKAEECIQKSLQWAKEIGDKHGEAAAYENLGNVFYFLGEYVKAQKYLQKALQIQRETGDKHGEAISYVNLESVFQSLGEYAKAEEMIKKALQIQKEIGDKHGESISYANLGNVLRSFGEYVKAEQYLQKALQIKKEIGDVHGEARIYVILASVFQSLSEYVKAEEYVHKALHIQKEIGDKRGEAECYGQLGRVFLSLGDYAKTEQYIQKALHIRKEIGDKRGEVICHAELGSVFQSLGEYVKAEQYLQKALQMQKEIGRKQGEAASCMNLGRLFLSLGDYTKAEEYLRKALVLYKEIGYKEGEAKCYANLGDLLSGVGEHINAKEYYDKVLALSYEIGSIELQFGSHLDIALNTLELTGNIDEAVSNFLASIQKCEQMRRFLRDNDHFKISFLDMHMSPYKHLSFLFCSREKFNEALYVVELGRAKSLADMLSAQYCVSQEISVNPQSWVGIEKIMTKETNSVCLYLSYDKNFLLVWIIKPNKILYRLKDIRDCFMNKEAAIFVDKVFSNVILRKFHVLPAQEHCEDRSLFPPNAGLLARASSQGDGSTASRPIELEEDENLEPPSLAQCYNMIIAPVADLLDEPEIIIVPDRILYKVPFAALKNQNEEYLSKSFKIRIVPSLSTLKLIQDSPADYHSQTGALIVGEPDVGDVYFKGRLEKLCPLPCAREEAEMIGRLLGAQPLLGEHATKQVVLRNMHSVGLIHFAAHGDAERGEIALAPPRPFEGTPQEEDYLLTMAEISQVRLTAKLVVLSCCHSAHGKVRSEGVVGIARAFLGSGARSVLVALWALEDKATKHFMLCFYEHLVRGESASESLHQAMIWMRDNGFSDVLQWAPFMLMGDDVTFDFGQ